MISQAQVERVWDGMLLAEMRALYFADLAVRYNRWQRALTLLTLFLSSGAFVTMIAKLPENLPYKELIAPLFALTAAALSAYSFAAQIPKRAIDASDLSFRWLKLMSQYESIWENTQAADAFERLQKADEAVMEASKSSHQIPYRKRIFSHWQDHVEAQRGFAHA